MRVLINFYSRAYIYFAKVVVTDLMVLVGLYQVLRQPKHHESIF